MALPLEGMKVLDLSNIMAGPYCTMVLGDMGAEVLKVENFPEGDGSRRFDPKVNGESYCFAVLNRNKGDHGAQDDQARPGARFRRRDRGGQRHRAGVAAGHPGEHDPHDQHLDHGRRRDTAPIRRALGRGPRNRDGLDSHHSVLGSSSRSWMVVRNVVSIERGADKRRLRTEL